MIRHLILGTAGHIDHGKSTLIRKLTGMDPDRLPEEKKRGITIDLGFATFDVDAEEGVIRFGVVDVPGHEDFVRNMVAGVGGMSLALLVVAADDGWMPQTEEHLQILEYLGLERILVVLSKVDLCDEARCTEVGDSIRERLKTGPFAKSSILPVSAQASEGMEELKEALYRLAKDHVQDEEPWAQLWVDRAFIMKGLGTVVTGSLMGSGFSQGDELKMHPGGQMAKVRSLQNHGKTIGSSQPGMRLAVQLGGVEMGEGGVRRGSLLTTCSTLEPFERLDAVIHRVEGGRMAHEAKALRSAVRVWVHLGTTARLARLRLEAGRTLMPGESCLASLTLDEPLACFEGDRFVIRDSSQRWTMGGGIVLAGVKGRRPSFGSSSRQQLLRERAEAPAEVTVWVESQVKEEGVVPLAGILPNTRFHQDVIGKAVEGSEVIAKIGTFAWLQSLESEVRAAVLGKLESFHGEFPNLPGMNSANLIRRKGIPPEAMDQFLHHGGKGVWTVEKGLVSLLGHSVQCPPHLQAEVDRLKDLLNQDPMDPPSRRVLCSEKESEEALRYLETIGEVICPERDLVLTPAGYNRIRRMVKGHLRKAGKATVSDLRQAVGASRRVVMPVLDVMDRQGLTKRDGDFRSLKSPSP